MHKSGSLRSNGKPYKSFFKFVLDQCIAIPAVIILAPILFILILLLAINNNGKPFFIQRRVGKNDRIFYLFKFRTMNERKNNYGMLLPDKERLSRLGMFIRRTSLDELPQLLNVIIGQMSIVGPRPLLIDYLPLYNDEQRKRHNVRPGITGWAQVNGRNAISWEQKFKYDVWYVDNISLRLDFKILLLTIRKIMISEGINEKGQSTMTAFKGNKSEIR